MKIGAQLYTVREFCKTPHDFSETLKRIADIGYRFVQVSGTCSYTPEWLRDRLYENGLSCQLTHTPFERMLQNPEQVAAEHQLFQCPYIGIGGYNGLENESDVEKVVQGAKTVAPVFKQVGALFLYHNHYTEMAQNKEGKTRLLELAEKTTSDELGITLDTYWLQYGGGDLSDYCKLLAGRLPCVHFKDMKVVGREVRMSAVGDGTLNFEKLLPILADGGTRYVFVEQDNTYGEDPFVCLERSYRYLKSIGLES